MSRRDARGQGVFVYADPSCRRCGRRLASELAVARGFGPTCWRKANETKGENDETIDGEGETRQAT